MARPKKAEVCYELKNGELTLEVMDRGRGFDLANVESQAGGTEKFGLFGMRQRLELHQGRLVVESAPGRGTSVKVILPAATVLASPAASFRARVRRVYGHGEATAAYRSGGRS